MSARAVPALLLLLAGCPAQPLPEGPRDLPRPLPPPVLRGPSRASTIAVADDDSVVAMVNPEEGTLATFSALGLHAIGRVRTGNLPSAVVIHPDRTTAFVANRGDATVVRLTGVGSTTPTLSEPIPVGAEPTGLALSPTGAWLFVAEWAEGRVSVIDATSLRVVGTITGLRAPRTLLVTNDGDAADSDELLVIPEFFGEPTEGGEARDTGRLGRVHVVSLADLSVRTSLTLQPLSAAEAGFGAAAAPNQLVAVTARGGRVYIAATAASPEGPLRPHGNVNPVVFVADLAARAEVRGAGGSFSVARLLGAAPPPRLFLADPSSLAFAPDTPVAYLLSRGTDLAQRLILDDAAARLGDGAASQIDLAAGGCRGPTGIAFANTAQRAFVNCWLSRRLGVLDLATQSLRQTLPATADADAPEDAMARGRRLFHSARGRLSRQGWSSCASCHPDGWSDGITWSFPAGPRQTPSLAGVFSRSATTPWQRVLGWTANWDEIHDFEELVRTVSGGLGAITTAGSDGACGDLSAEAPVDLASAGLGAPTAREAQEGPGVRCGRDWDDLEAYLRALRPPRGRRGLETAAVRRGAALFGAGGCVKCHGGAGWTVSRRFYEPSREAVERLAASVPFVRPPAWPASWTVHRTYQIAPQPAAAEVAGQDGAPIGPPQLACALRNVATFGVAGDWARTDALERKAGGGRAQGRGGYAVPSLYALALGAPYLHHGQARTLADLLGDPRFRSHTEAGAAGFLQGEDATRDREDLIRFLLSIDADTSEQPVPEGFGAGCQAP